MLRTRLSDDLKEALKSKNKAEAATLRLILAALKDRDIAARAKGDSDGIGEDQILEMLQKMVRQRRDSIELYEQGGRPELAEREREEIRVIERFLPQQLDEAAMQKEIDALIEELEAQSIKDMGRVMGVLKERFAGRMDFAKASALVKDRLA